MKEPDPPDDFDEMEAEAETPIVLTVPWEVIESVEAYVEAHSVDRNKLIALAIKAQEHRIDQFVETTERLCDDPDSFAWPLEDPLLCVAIAFMQNRAKTMGLTDDEDEPADWWKA